ncbi:hypothetical protein LTR27_003074 [Elasticomyces elasticus]|nr:hypothetical protein LTR27_003074 [Elasticomyces elasticus]
MQMLHNFNFIVTNGYASKTYIEKPHATWRTFGKINIHATPFLIPHCPCLSTRITIALLHSMSNVTPSRSMRALDVPFPIDTSKSSAMMYAGCLTPPQSAHETSRRGSLALCGLPETGYNGLNLLHANSLPPTPAHDTSSAGHSFTQWQQCPTGHTLDSIETTVHQYSPNHTHGNYQECILSPSRTEAMHHSLVPGGYSYNVSNDTHLEATWPMHTVDWSGHNSTINGQHPGLNLASYAEQSLAMGPRLDDSHYDCPSQASAGVNIDTAHASSFGPSMDSCYSHSQPTVVPSQLGGGQYLLPPFSTYSSPKGQPENVSASFDTISANSSFSGYTTPTTPEFGHSGNDGWYHVKDEDLSPTPNMLAHSHDFARYNKMSQRSQPRRNGRRSKARQPRDTYNYMSFDSIAVEVEGKACDVDYDMATRTVRYAGVPKQLKPHPCTMTDEKTGNRCTARFDRSEHLKRHQAKHSDMRPYMCPLPDCKHTKGIGRGDNAKDHFKTHLKHTHKGRRNTLFLWPDVRTALLREFQDEKISSNLITNIERWIRTSSDAGNQRNLQGEPLTENDPEYLARYEEMQRR